MRPERHNAVKVLLFLDVGGSMDPHIKLVEELFSAATTEFKNLEFFYFHNCIYEGVWKNNARRRIERTDTWEILHKYGHDYKVIFVGENFNHGPVWKAFERLQSFGMTKFDIRFQSSRFREDLVTILCARTMVESMSSLMTVTRLGFATRRFSMCCENHFPEAQQVYRVEPGKYNGGRHDNSADEWVAMLFHGNSPVPRLCTTDQTLMDNASSITSHCEGIPNVFGWEQ